MDLLNLAAIGAGYVVFAAIAFWLLRHLVVSIAEGVSLTLWNVHVADVKPSGVKLARVMARTCLGMLIGGRSFDALCAGRHEWHGVFDWRYNREGLDDDEEGD